MSSTSTISLRSHSVYLDPPLATPASSEGAPAPAPALPEPNDALGRMISSGDYGSSLAAMLMLSQKEQRATAKSARDSAYRAVEHAQGVQLEHMQDAADLKFATGIAQGSLQLGSAGLGLAAVKPGVEASTADYKLKDLPAGASSATRGDLLKMASAGRTQSEGLTGTARALDAYGTLVGAGGKLLSDAADREVTGDEQRVTSLQRIAADHASDVDEAQKSIDKTVDLFHEYVNVRNATLLAATQRT